MTILVTGGAGYIGSVTVKALLARGKRVVVVDNLTTGHAAAVPANLPFYSFNLCDTEALQKMMLAENVTAVVHFAAYSLVGESVQNPAKYIENNVGGSMSLLAAMKTAGVRHIVFSSTAATYGEPEFIPLTEAHPTKPTNPYGMSKRFVEQIMETYDAAYGLRFAALRYFNACGAVPERGEDHKPESHLIPLILQVALGQRDAISVFGTNYPTPDGTCVRDYIHVADLAEAHLLALDYLAREDKSIICNLGNGLGFSVREVIETCRTVTGKEIPAKEAPRREGDPSRLIANATKARELLGWEPKRPHLKTIVEDAWAWHVQKPNGYDS
ncbi:MAG: UDP-glucose 4-epimerase GalE [Sumerlaeia bacterium]